MSLAPRPTPKQQQWIAAIRLHAKANYEHDGWDYVVECWDDSELLSIIHEAKSETEALNTVHELVKLKDEYRTDIQAEAF